MSRLTFVVIFTVLAMSAMVGMVIGLMGDSMTAALAIVLAGLAMLPAALLAYFSAWLINRKNEG